jgi:uncharacterized protein involved in propanediol utilization
MAGDAQTNLWSRVVRVFLYSGELRRLCTLELGHEDSAFFELALEQLRRHFAEGQTLGPLSGDGELSERIERVIKQSRRSYVRRQVQRFPRLETRQPSRRRRAGVGFATGHHGEIVQGAFQIAPRSLARGLVTLPYYAFRSEAKFQLHRLRRDRSDERIEVSPAYASKAARAAALTLDRAGVQDYGGVLFLETRRAEVGAGGGSSTMDVVASIRSVAQAIRWDIGEEDIAWLAVAAEPGTDAIMFPNIVLFAQREGWVIERFGPALPPMWILGFNSWPGHPMLTSEHPPARYTTEELSMFDVLRAAIRRAVRERDAALLGRAAQASATISERRLPNRAYGKLSELADSLPGCVGFQVSHSGRLAGLLFDGRSETDAARAEAQQELERAGFADLYWWRTDKVE